ncbi:unnamed protein product [Rhizophagus irregularis]|uniref:S-adenosyl-L-methionine-dependent methyltransferase n=1 Tax=Rhizophagus irregularis TaxID=588596 RepID=A0A2N1MS52_9GLOM|nr:S-adenosyl-L-methionine-dependent methyltransferase [Rhizophagus irregularis]CAB4374097.1 unnamed protein product [Rhizophagus irregularis]CAB5374211.1 unnamed protein product [Rhizophagus irregularis]
MGATNSTSKRRLSKRFHNNNFLINDSYDRFSNNIPSSKRRISSESTISSHSTNSFDRCTELIKTFGSRKYFNRDHVKDIFPTDNDELKRLELTHIWNKELWEGQSFFLPVDEVFSRNAKVLDIGCGTGIWSLDMARKYPNCHFTGLDIVDNFPLELKQSNVDFALGNILEGLPYDDNTFDLVFMRNMKGCLSQKDYNKCLQEIIRVSSRWILILDSDIILIDGGPLANQLREEVLDELMKNYDINMMPSSIIRKCLEDNNQLSDIHFEDKQCPIGEWGGRLGTLYLEILKWATKNLYHSVSTLYSEEEYNLKVDEAFEELNHYNGYDMVFRICAKKNVEKRKSLKKIVRNT